MSLGLSAPTLANASPSVALEKGAHHRTRASHRRTTSSINSSNPVQRCGQPRNQHDPKLVALLLLLVFACLTCFGTVYCLVETRWETPTQSLTPALHANTPFPGVNASIHDNEPHENDAVHPEERFLAYLPHSGFHNQRIAFENALVLARLLNRTLIVPPIRLGDKPIPYRPLDRLARQLALTGKGGLGHCARVPPKIAVPPECFDYFDYTYLPWDWLVNLTPVRAKQKLFSRTNFDLSWFNDSLGIFDDQILHFRDQTPYQYRVVDSGRTRRVNERNWYTEDLSLDLLAQKTQKLLFFGTLFGSTRLRLGEEAHISVRKEIRDAMMIAHPVLDLVSESIFKTLGTAYLAIHLRAAEPKFKPAGEVNARRLWWTLLNCFLNTTADDTMRLEKHIGSGTSHATGFREALPPLLSSRCTPLDNVETSHLTLASQAKCRQSKTPFTLGLLGPNPPLLYIATDLKNVQNQPLISRFRAIFPCTSHLADFTRHLAPLDHLTNTIDGVPLRSHLLPFVDALVAAKALRVVGTRGSTFSYFIEDILWRRIHKLPIKQRG